MNNLVTKWSSALDFASSQAANTALSLIILVDPCKTSNFIIGDILTALSAGFASPSVPEVSGVAFGIEEATVTAPRALVTALKQPSL